MKQTGRRCWTKWWALALAGALLSPGAALAVTDEEIFRDFRFNLANPGARSLGLGGAFIAVADDATASLANPAGLMLLSRPEFFTEVRKSTPDDSEIEQTLFGAEITSGTDPATVFSPSFFSFVHPWERFAVGISRVELNKVSNVASNDFLLDFFGNVFEFRGSGRIENDLTAWNVTGAFKIGETLSVGATAAFGFLDTRSHVDNSFVDTIGVLIDPNIISQATLDLYSTWIDDTDTDVAFNVGIHWMPHERLSFGAVYRGGLEFQVEESIEEEVAVMNVFFGQTITGLAGSSLDTTFSTPDTYGAGVAWHPLNTLTISVDWIHLQYEDLLEGFQAGLNILTIFDTEANFTIEDADEFHFGIEYVFTAGRVPWAVRAGAFTDHNSRIYADFEEAGGMSMFSNSESFPERDTETHITLGTGVVVKERFQIDAAVSLSDLVNEFVLSTIFRF